MVQTQTPFGEWLEARLAERDWTAADLTRASRTPDNPRGLDSGLISRWRRPPPLAAVPTHVESFASLARAFRIPETEVYRAAGRIPPDLPSSPVQTELEARLHQLGTTLSKYPRVFWLAVLEASERFAEAAAPTTEPPVSAPEVGPVSAPGEPLTRPKTRRRKGFTPYQPAFVTAAAGV